MDHRQPRRGRAKVGNSFTLQRTDVDSLQIGTAKGHTGHPRSDAPPGGKQHLLIHLVREKRPLQFLNPLRIALVEQQAKIPSGCKHEELIGVHHRAPQISQAIEGDPVGPRPLPQAGGSKHLAVAQASIFANPQSADTTAGGLHHIHKFFPRIHADFIGEVKAISDDAEFPIDVSCNVAVRQISAQSVHPVLNAGGDGDPDAILRIAQDKVDFTDGLAFDGVGKYRGCALAGHHFEAVRAEVRNQNIAIARKGQTVG